jgi:tRNA threonylcarbamoyladenosine biosynthesis protein TsaB
MYTLALDTSTKNCSVGLFKDGELLNSINHQEEGYAHSEKLMSFIEKVCVNSQIKVSEVKSLLVSNGPGSYTGLRIGASAVKGIAYANNGNVITISSLEVLCYSSFEEASFLGCDLIIPMIDARRDEVYCGEFNLASKSIEKERAQIIDEDFFQSLTEKKVLICGDGIEKFKERFNHFSNIVWGRIEVNKVDDLGGYIEQSHVENRFADLAYFEPNYIKSYIPGKKKNLFS